MEDVMINWLAVGVATLVGFVIGFIWYGPLFGKAWMKEAGLSEEDVQNGNMAKIFGLTAVFQFIMAYCLAMFFGNDINASDGASSFLSLPSSTARYLNPDQLFCIYLNETEEVKLQVTR